MDFNLLMIFIFIVAVVAVVMTTVGEIVKRHIRFKERELEVIAGETAEKAAQYAGRIQQMEERIRVLERIATDRGDDLARQIEALRSADDGQRLIEEKENIQ